MFIGANIEQLGLYLCCNIAHLHGALDISFRTEPIENVVYASLERVLAALHPVNYKLDPAVDQSASLPEGKGWHGHFPSD
jgi:hypothetical protein